MQTVALLLLAFGLIVNSYALWRLSADYRRSDDLRRDVEDAIDDHFTELDGLVEQVFESIALQTKINSKVREALEAIGGEVARQGLAQEDRGSIH